MKQIIQIKYAFAALIKAEKTKTSSVHKALRHGAPMAFYSDSSSQVPGTGRYLSDPTASLGGSFCMKCPPLFIARLDNSFVSLKATFRKLLWGPFHHSVTPLPCAPGVPSAYSYPAFHIVYEKHFHLSAHYTTLRHLAAGFS